MKKHPKRVLLVNTCGAMGYMSCLLLWGWTGIVYLPLILANERVEQLLLPTPREEPIVQAPVADPSPALAVVALVVTIIVLLLTLFVLFRAPVAIAKTGKAVTTKAANSALPLVTRGRPLPPAKKRQLTVRLVKVMKFLLVILPVLISFIGALVELPLPFELVIFASSLLAILALLWFSAQYLGAYALKVDPKQLL